MMTKVNILFTNEAAANSGVEWWPIIKVSVKDMTIVPIWPIIIGIPR